MKLVWNIFVRPIAIPQVNKRGWSCSVRNGFLKTLSPDLKKLLDKMPAFTGTPNFRASLAAWGIDEVYAGNAAAHILKEHKIAGRSVQKVIGEIKAPPYANYKEMDHTAQLEMRDFVDKLSNAFQDTGISIFLSNDTPAIYFLADADGYFLFRCLGKGSTMESTKGVTANCIQSKAMKGMPLIGNDNSTISREVISLSIEHLRSCKRGCEQKLMARKGYHPDAKGLYVEDEVEAQPAKDEKAPTIPDQVSDIQEAGPRVN